MIEATIATDRFDHGFVMIMLIAAKMLIHGDTKRSRLNLLGSFRWAFVDGFVFFDGLENLDVGKEVLVDRQWVLRENDEIGNLAHFDTSFGFFFEVLPGWPDGECLSEPYLL